MTIFRRLAAACLFAVGLFAVASPAVAGVIWTFEQSGGNVVGTMSGSIDTTGLVLVPFTKEGVAIDPSLGEILSGPDGNCSGDPVAFTHVVSPFGPGGVAVGTTTGDVFVMKAGLLCLPLGYTSGDPLSGTLTFAAASFASLGITPGTYVNTLRNDTVTLRFGVPEPATLALLGLGLAGLAATRRRKLH